MPGSLSTGKVETAMQILSKYEGTNPEIRRIKYRLSKDRTFVPNDFHYEYILMNHERKEPVKVDRTVKIAEYYGLKLQQSYCIDFVPQKIHVGYLIGETTWAYHCYARWRKSMKEFASLMIPKRALLNPLFEIQSETGIKDVDFDTLNGMLSTCSRKLKEHQEAGIRFLVKRRKCILADEQGLGKTMMLIGAALAAKFSHVLVICPSSLKTNWKKEFSFFGIEDVSIVEGTKEENWDLSKKYVICNYDIFDNHLHKVAYEMKEEYQCNLCGLLFTTKKSFEYHVRSAHDISVPLGDTHECMTVREKKVKSKSKQKIESLMSVNPLVQAKFDAVIIDEAHKLSNRSSNRYKAIKDYILQGKIENVWLSTGTPISNNAENYFNILSIIDHSITNDYRYYMTHFRNAYEIRLKTGRKILLPREDRNLDELREKTKHVYLRRLKDELKDLPDRNIIERYYDLTAEEREKYNILWKEYEEAQLEMLPEDPENMPELHRELIEGGLLRRFLAGAMIPHTIELAEEHIADGSKIIIGCCYTAEIDRLKEHFKAKCVTYQGGMTAKQRDGAQDKFTNDPSVKVFIGNIQAAGVGLTLVSSNITIMNSFDWTPSGNQQFQDRNYRLGQTKEVTTYYQLFSGTYSEHMWNTLMKKLMTITTVVKDERSKNS
jgi:SWI/SNF-related matrix-associated actin-dependent regulator 1 of chromatin subfamily A